MIYFFIKSDRLGDLTDKKAGIFLLWGYYGEKAEGRLFHKKTGKGGEEYSVSIL